MNFPIPEDLPPDLLQAVVLIGQSQIGVRESPLGSNRGPEVDRYLSTTGLASGNYWCAAFVYWLYDQAAKKLGVPNPMTRSGSVMKLWNEARKAARVAEVPQPGMVFIISHGGGTGHTGIVEGVHGGVVQTIEGNTNEAGQRNGIGVFRRKRAITQINRGFIDYRL
ncbi:MAG: CHAP domain-containing protein [Chlorobi bacterium]|nr:CHAP domain-containing protein [Chlorobiota bacterium]